MFKPTSIKNLIYYDYNIHNLIIHKYFLGLHKVDFFFLINISSTRSPFCRIRNFVQIEFFKIILNFTFKIGFFNVLNIK